MNATFSQVIVTYSQQMCVLSTFHCNVTDGKGNLGSQATKVTKENMTLLIVNMYLNNEDFIHDYYMLLRALQKVV